jgi:hypothetical protein
MSTWRGSWRDLPEEGLWMRGMTNLEVVIGVQDAMSRTVLGRAAASLPRKLLKNAGQGSRNPDYSLSLSGWPHNLSVRPSAPCSVLIFSSGQIRTLDKNGNEITSVGFQRFGFDCEVSLDAVRSLYLRPHYVANATDGQTSQVTEEDKGHNAYQSNSIYIPQTQSISYTTLARFTPVKLLSPSIRKRVLVTGGAGFVGSHLVDRLMLLGHEVTVIDNFFTGSKTSVSHWVGHPNFDLVRHDVVEPFMIECDRKCDPYFLFLLFVDVIDQKSIILPALLPRCTTSSTRSRRLRHRSRARSTCSVSRNAPKRVS